MNKPDALIEQGVEVLRRLSVAKVSLSDAAFIAGWVSDARTALRQQALSLPITAEPGVKPLQWVGDEAETPFGHYRLYRTDDGWGLSFNDDELVHVGFNSVASFESPREKAMSYAQPQYRAAILSTLTGKE